MADVSIIIPLYNKGRLVARALASVFAQTHADFEVIVVDDGSTDIGPNVVREWADSRLRLISQQNAGPGAARNKGVRASTASYLTFLDADDEWLPTFLQRSLAALEANPDCVLSAVNHFRSSDDNPPRPVLQTFAVPMGAGPWRLPPDMPPSEMQAHFFYLMAGNVVWRRDAYLTLGGSYERRCTRSEDQYLFLQAMLRHWIYWETEALFWYHTEDSELLDQKRRSPRTLFPYLADPDPIRQSCPAEYRPILERFFDHVAEPEFAHMIADHDLPAAAHLLRAFPRIKGARLEYAKARLGAALPWAKPYVRPIRRLLRGITGRSDRPS